MAKFQSPLLGYNNNVRHKNRVFHIQTEDSGVNHPHIITHLFMDGGRILKSVKTSYAEHVGAEGMQETVRGLMKEQHKAIFIALRDGQFDALVDGGAAPAAKPAAAAEKPAASVNAVRAAEAKPVDAPAIAVATEAVAAAEGAEAALAAVVSEAVATAGVSAASPESVRPPASAELAPVTIDETKRPRSIVPPPSAAQIAGPRIGTLAPPPMVTEDVPVTTRQSPEARPDAATASKPARELTVDFDQLEQAALDGAASSLFHSADLPPPPKNMFAKEPGTGGAYRAVVPNPADAPRRDAREEPEARRDPREEPAGAGPVSRPQPVRTTPARVPAGRPPGEARYAPARPAAIFGSTQRPPPTSLFSDDLVSDKSLDEVILSYLAEDLEPTRRK